MVNPSFPGRCHMPRTGRPGQEARSARAATPQALLRRAFRERMIGCRGWGGLPGCVAMQVWPSLTSRWSQAMGAAGAEVPGDAAEAVRAASLTLARGPAMRPGHMMMD